MLLKYQCCNESLKSYMLLHQGNIQSNCNSLYSSEDLVKEIADHMVADGYKDAGYEYVSIDVSVHDPVQCGSLIFIILLTFLVQASSSSFTLDILSRRAIWA